MTYGSFGQPLIKPWLYWVLIPIHRLLLSLYFRKIIIQGMEHLPINGPVVLAPKHCSRWDAVVLAVLSVEPLWFMANANQFGGIQGWFIRRLGAFPVDLEQPKVSSFRNASSLLRSHQKVMIFPEGGIVCDQLLRSLKPGLAFLVQQAENTPEMSNIPVVPIAVQYEPAAIFRAKITIRIAPPLYVANYSQDNKKATALAFTQALQASLINGMQALATG